MPEVVRWHLKTLNIMATPLHEEIQKFYEEEPSMKQCMTLFQNLM